MSKSYLKKVYRLVIWALLSALVILAVQGAPADAGASVDTDGVGAVAAHALS